MKRIIKTSIIIMVLIIAGCKKDEVTLFDINDSGVMFPGAGDAKTYKGYNSADDIYYVNESFLNVPLTQNTYVVDFPVRVSGDRVVGFEIIEDSTTAVSTQYEITEALIPAGQTYGRIRFVLTRDVALDDAAVMVAIRLKDSEDLKVGSNEYRKGILTWSNMLAMFPASSSYTRTYNCIILTPLSKISTSRAYYSPNAHKAILDALGWPITYWPAYSGQYADPNTGTNAMLGVYYTDLYAQKLKAYLDAYAEANGGVRLKHNAGTDIGKDIQPRTTGAVYIP
ncbi:MAG: DUF4843 domain-containing protein [Bacteroidales bacterium]|nr:DUF4843 domain-containing protein [Bacteroidales bacterium]